MKQSHFGDLKKDKVFGYNSQGYEDRIGINRPEINYETKLKSH